MRGRLRWTIGAAVGAATILLGFLVSRGANSPGVLVAFSGGLVVRRPARDRWSEIAEPAAQAVASDFDWELVAGGSEPVVRTHEGRLLVIVHPLRHVDGEIVGWIASPDGPVFPVDVFNFDRRPGEIFLRRNR